MQFASLSILLVSAVAVIVDGEKLIKRKFEFPSLLKEELKHAATRKPRVKRAGFAAALAPAMANAAGDVLSNVGKKLVEGATTVLTAGATHVAEAEAKRKENEKEAEEGITNAKGQTAAYDRATISLMPRKGEIGFGDSLSIEPPGFAVSASFSKDEKEPETQHSSNEFVKFPFGLGFAMLNGCYRTGYQPGDPCYAATLKMTSNLCLDMLDAAAFIGVGFNGRGDYSAEYRKKSVIQRLCASKSSFGGAQVPDTMNVFGVYDTEVMQTTFSSATQYQEYLESKAAVSSYKHSFSEALRKSFGVSAKFSYGLFSGAKASIDTKGKTSSSKSKSTSTQAASSANGHRSDEKQSTFMSMLEVNVIRFEIFMDDVVPSSLNQAFLADFLALPTSYFDPRAPMKYQNFILRWGTHFIKSAKFGGHLRLTRTKTFKGTASIRQFAETANTDTQSLFANSFSSHRGHGSMKGGMGFLSVGGSASYEQDNKFDSASRGTGGSKSSASSESNQASQASTYGNEYMLVEGGSHRIASILSDFYAPTFKDNFERWLDSIPEFPKPFEFQMGTLADLLDINVKSLFNTEIENTDQGCSPKAALDEVTGEYYYEVRLANNTQITRRYCKYGRTPEELQRNFDMRRRALTRSIAVYMEEGPIPTYDLHLKGGSVGCETFSLHSLTQTTNSLIPKWSYMTSGSYFKVLFDAPFDIPGVIGKNDLLEVAFTNDKWYSKRPDEPLRLYSGFNNGGTSNTDNQKISINALIMTYNQSNGLLTVSQDDFTKSNESLSFLPSWLAGSIIAHAEVLNPMKHLDSKSGINPCSVRFTNSYRINPATKGGECIKFTAASEGDIFLVFATIPHNHNTWYYVQISPSGFGIFKGIHLMYKDTSFKARGLGDRALYQSYFVCLLEDKGTDGNGNVTISYGISRENMAVGDILVVWTDILNPLSVEYFAFGAGEKEVNIMDIHVVSKKDMGELVCKHGPGNRQCMQNCHTECQGCYESSSDTSCVACKHYRHPSKTESTCVPSCPSGTSEDPKINENICSCNLAHINDPYVCLDKCPIDTYQDGRICKVDPCSKHPCNTGTCKSNKGDYSCKCPPSHTGQHCQSNMCEGYLCRNNGRCTKLGVTYGCECQPGFSGGQCEININECATNPCMNKGICEDQINKFKCHCLDGYNGENCQKDNNMCAHQGDLCVRGRCENLENDFRCICPYSYEGRRCKLGCPHGWVYTPGSHVCYRVLDIEYRNYTNSDELCREKFGQESHLADLKSDKDMDAYQQLPKISLGDIYLSGMKTDNEKHVVDYSGRRVKYRKFPPKGEIKESLCILIMKKLWYQRHCEMQLGFSIYGICQIPLIEVM